MKTKYATVEFRARGEDHWDVYDDDDEYLGIVWNLRNTGLGWEQASSLWQLSPAQLRDISTFMSRRQRRKK